VLAGTTGPGLAALDIKWHRVRSRDIARRDEDHAGITCAAEPRWLSIRTRPARPDRVSL